MKQETKSNEEIMEELRKLGLHKLGGTSTDRKEWKLSIPQTEKELIDWLLKTLEAKDQLLAEREAEVIDHIPHKISPDGERTRDIRFISLPEDCTESERDYYRAGYNKCREQVIKNLKALSTNTPKI